MSDYYDSNSKCIVLNPVYHTKKNGTQTSIPCSEFGKKISISMDSILYLNVTSFKKLKT